MEEKWLNWSKRMQAIAQAGLTYSKDPYDIERFQELRQISLEIMSEYTNLKNMKKIEELFANETGYQTPKVDIRGVVYKNSKLLFVKEKSDGGWSLPGGWADVGFTPSEIAVKEIHEESGYKTEPKRLLAVLDMSCHPHPPAPYHIYKIFIECSLIGGRAETGLETEKVSFFGRDELPALSVQRNTESQIKMLFDQLEEKKNNVIFD
ncbi:NUDIX hydrolase [Scopulibacillus cellulosilyticus]|uniref:NUDIX hydrolase n=1 Tax=Scopulibacillus cellulosilyticus TaxID=2665665 RepID=A0ABW2PVJ5_9BACL